MPKLEKLTKDSPEIKNLQMQAQGFCIWLVWEGELNPVIPKTLEDHGGLQVSSGEGQSLWFFFSKEVCSAAGRLGAWSRFNPTSLFSQIFPAKMVVGDGGLKTVEIDASFNNQTVEATNDFQIWVHPDAVKAAEGTLGITFLKDQKKPSGLSSASWSLLQAGTRMPFEPSMAWYVILKAVGSPSDRKFQLGWHEFLPNLEALLQRNKFRFTIKDYFVMLPLEGGLNRLRDWCRDFLLMIERVKSPDIHQYWPCVMAIVEKKNLNFSDELRDKVGLDWRQLAPDYPHLTAKNAFMLGDGFTIQSVRFSLNKHTPDDWCTVSLASDEANAANLLPHLVSEVALGGFPHCFYCGQRSHEAKDCPTRSIETRDEDVWKQIAFLDFDAMSGTVKKINIVFQKKGIKGVESLIPKQTPEGLFLRALFDINWPVQLRSLDKFWRARDKELKTFTPKDKSEETKATYSALKEFHTMDPEQREKSLSMLGTRYPNNFRIMTLRGFDAMERGDWSKALLFWKEAEVGSPCPAVSTWHLFLQARAYEAQSMLTEAISLYNQVNRQAPSWKFVIYRKIICDVKSGFSHLAIPDILQLAYKDPNFFNQVLIDPEMERGHSQILATLNALWLTCQSDAKIESDNLKRILNDLPNWFVSDHEFAAKLKEKIETFLEFGKIRNYVTLQTMVQGRSSVEKEMQKFVSDEGRILRDLFKSELDRLKYIKDESAWYPFPNSLKEFNRKYNESVAVYNWITKANLHLPDAFKKAQQFREEQDERLKFLDNKMRFLRIIRDSTLFSLTVLEVFVKIEIVGLILIFGIIPVIIAYGGELGLSWTSGLLQKEQFSVQKVLFFFLSFLAGGIALLRTILRFDTIKEKVFAKAKDTNSKK